MGQRNAPATIVGIDVETKLIRSEWADVKLYGDFDKLLDESIQGIFDASVA